MSPNALRRDRPWLLAYVLGLAPSALLGTALIGALVWCFLCFGLAATTAPQARLRHMAGLGLGLFGSLTLVFFQAWDLRPLALLLFIPPVVLWGLTRCFGPWCQSLFSRNPSLAALLCILGVLGPYALAAQRGTVPALNDDFLYAAGAPSSPAPLSDEARVAAIDIVRAALTERPTSEPIASVAELERGPTGRVYVSLIQSSRGKPGRRQRIRLARGVSEDASSLAEALRTATQDALRQQKSPRSWRRKAQKIRIQIDLAGPEQRLGPSPVRRAAAAIISKLAWQPPAWDFVVYRAVPGIDGFRLEGAPEDGVVLPGDVLLNGTASPRNRRKRFLFNNFEGAWRLLCRRAGQTRGNAGDRSFLRFRTYAFAQPKPTQQRTVELYRQNVLLDEELDEEGLLKALEFAGQWLLEQVEDDGRFDYQYYPNTDSHGRGYNEVRHAGSVYGLFRLYEFARNEPSLQHAANSYLRAAVLGLERVYRNLGPGPGVDEKEGYVVFLEGDGGEKSNSGAVALSLLSFLHRPQPEEVNDPEIKASLIRPGDKATIEGLARTLLKMIDKQGRVYEYWPQALAGKGVKKEPLYYPGESMLALALMHQRTGERRWLEAAKSIGRNQIRRGLRPWSVPDHWVIQALDWLDLAEPEAPEWRQGAYAMGKRYVREQHPPQRPPFADYRGSYRRIQEVPRTARAASRGEAIGGVARIAWRHGDPSWHWERSLLEGAHHLVEQQFTDDNAFYFARPEEVLGAIRMGIIDNHCRIDNNQHAIVALANALEALRHRRGRTAGSSTPPPLAASGNSGS